jgi:hypothetical protein
LDIDIPFEQYVEKLINQYPRSSTKHMMTTHPFQFTGRDATMKLIFDRWNSMAMKGFDKTERPILHLIAGPGVGKSRIIDELLPQLINIANDPARENKKGEILPKMLRKCIHIPLTFANDTPVLKKIDADVSTSFPYRLLYAYFLQVTSLGAYLQ